MTTEQQDAVGRVPCSSRECSLNYAHAGPCDGRRPVSEDTTDDEREAKVVAWSRFQEDYGQPADEDAQGRERVAFYGGWTARGEMATEAPRAVGGIVTPDDRDGRALAELVREHAGPPVSFTGERRGDADAWHALGTLHKAATDYLRDHPVRKAGAASVTVNVTTSIPPDVDAMVKRAEASLVQMDQAEAALAQAAGPTSPPASVDTTPWWRSEAPETTVVAPVPVQRDVADALRAEFGHVPMSVRARIARAMLPLLEAAADDGSPHRPPRDEEAPVRSRNHPCSLEPFHPDGDPAARGDEPQETETPSPTADDLEAWRGLRPGHVLGNIYRSDEREQTWLELMLGWDESGPTPVPMVAIIRDGGGRWKAPHEWRALPMLPGHRRRVITRPDLTGAPIALRHLVYPHVSGETLVLGPEALAGPERVGEHAHPRIIMYRGAAYVLGDDAPEVPGVNAQTLRAAWVAGEDGLTARIGGTVYAKVRPAGETVGVRVPGEPRPTMSAACSLVIKTTQTREEPGPFGSVNVVPSGTVQLGPCVRPRGHTGYHRNANGDEFNDEGKPAPF